MTYLALSLFALQLALGANIALLSQNLAGGNWGPRFLIALENISRKTWIAVFAFAINLVLPNPIHAERASFAAVIVRTMLALAIFVWTSYACRKSSRVQWAFALIALFFAATTLTFDWVAGLDVKWNSSILGVLYLGGGFVGAISLACLRAPEPETKKWYLKGNLLFAASCIWAYLVLSQLMVVYMGFEPDKLSYLVERASGFWKPVTFAMWGCGFVVPFFVLLFRTLKRQAWILQTLACAALVTRWLEIAHWIYPNRAFVPLTFALGSACALVIAVLFAKVRA